MNDLARFILYIGYGLLLLCLGLYLLAITYSNHIFNDWIVEVIFLLLIAQGLARILKAFVKYAPFEYGYPLNRLIVLLRGQMVESGGGKREQDRKR